MQLFSKTTQGEMGRRIWHKVSKNHLREKNRQKRVALTQEESLVTFDSLGISSLYPEYVPYYMLPFPIFSMVETFIAFDNALMK